jgi:hypothetical protein
LPELEFGSFPEIESDERNLDVTYSATPSPFVLVIISLVVVFICIILAVCIVKWRQKHSKPDQRFARNSVHIRHPSAVSVCCQCRDWCYGSKTEKPNDDHMFQKTNFNGFDTGEYEDMMINTTTDSVPALPVTSPKRSVSSAKRTSFVTDHKANPDDFMSNLAPQWPEPEAQWPEPEENTTGQHEYDPFIRHHHSTFDPQKPSCARMN